MGDISGIGTSRHIPQQLPEQQEVDFNQNQTNAINLFNTLIDELTSLAHEDNLGGKNHGQ